MGFEPLPILIHTAVDVAFKLSRVALGTRMRTTGRKTSVFYVRALVLTYVNCDYDVNLPAINRKGWTSGEQELS